MATFELYRRSTIGMCLTETLDEMVSNGILSPELAIQVLVQFDKSMTEALESQVKSKVTIKIWTRTCDDHFVSELYYFATSFRMDYDWDLDNWMIGDPDEVDPNEDPEEEFEEIPEDEPEEDPEEEIPEDEPEEDPEEEIPEDEPEEDPEEEPEEVPDEAAGDSSDNDSDISMEEDAAVEPENGPAQGDNAQPDPRVQEVELLFQQALDMLRNERRENRDLLRLILNVCQELDERLQVDIPAMAAPCAMVNQLIITIRGAL